jgi:crotonobetainyl-CoA:carnitine CoA-transferase CaiB-like acyl-CoA transferase
VLDAIFRGRSLCEWEAALSSQEGQWAVIQTAGDALDDPQNMANGYIREVKYENGATLPLVTTPVQFDGHSPGLVPAPDHAADTDAVLTGIGLTTDELLSLKVLGAIS